MQALDGRRNGTALALEPGFDFMSEDYAELFAAAEATAFQHPIWLDCFYRHMLAPSAAEKVVLVGRAARGGRLQFVLPLVRRSQSGVVLVEAANLGVGDYAHPVMRRGWLPDGPLAGAVKAALPPHDLLNIRPMRDEAVASWRLFFGMEDAPLSYSAHAVALSGTFRQWRAAAYDPSFARNVDRKKKRFFKSGIVDFARLSGPGEVRQAIDAIARFRAGRFEGDLLQQDFARRFYGEVAARGAQTGLARTYRLTLDGEMVAATFGLTHRGRFCSILVAGDYQRFGRHSPGFLLDDLVLEDWIGDGGAVFDFTIGDESYKHGFGTSPTPMHAIVAPANLKGRAAATAFATWRTLRQLNRTMKPAEALASTLRSARQATSRWLFKAGLVPFLIERQVLMECCAVL
jgi:CelD/BcsL family acetyltransferase involved in cellulose biosynthesis